MYVDLKMLRKTHNRMSQDELAGILGVTQSVISRMENMHYDLDDSQYSLLVAHFGANDVAPFVKENPTKNLTGVAKPPKPTKEIAEGDNLSLAIKILSETVLRQADTISHMQEKINELNEHVAYLKQQKGDK